MTTKHQPRAVRRIQIMEAASKLIVRLGSEHLTVKSIARECDISEAAVYRHFKSKKDILFWLAGYIGDSLVNDIEEISSKQSISIRALDVVLDSHIAAIEHRRGTSFQVIAEIISFGDRELNDRAFEAVEKYVFSMQQLVGDTLKDGLLQENLNPRAVAVLISCLIQGLVNTWVLSNYTLDLKRGFSDMWKMVSKGILKMAGT